MISILRKNQRVLMLIVAILTIVAFIWLYNPANTRKLGTNTVATIYGRNLSQADIEREVKSFQLALALGQFQLLEDLGGMGQDENRALEQFVWNRLVIQHQARDLGIEPRDSQVADRIRNIPVFQVNGQFDAGKYKAFVAEQLGPRGFTEVQLENVIRDALRAERLKTVVSSPVAVSDAEVLETARIFQKVSAEVVRFDLAATAVPYELTDEEVKTFFGQNQPTLIMPETRSVDYVRFAIPEGGKSLEGREKVDALQKVADAASAFSEQASSGSFESAASTAGLTIQRTPEFDRSGAPRSSGDAPAAVDLKNFAPAVFMLTEKNPVSDVIQSGDVFFVLKLAKVSPQRPLTMGEVRPIAAKQLGARKAERALRDKADAALAKVREAIAAGKPFSEAAASAGLQVQSFNDLLPNDPKLSTREREIVAATLLMQPGQFSGMIPAADGGFAVYLSSRAPIDQADLAKKPELASRMLESKRHLLFLTWLASARDAAKIQVASPRR
jgi:peptidyl-prolyl cis-trans isomerase D